MATPKKSSTPKGSQPKQSAKKETPIKEVKATEEVKVETKEELPPVEEPVAEVMSAPKVEENPVEEPKQSAKKEASKKVEEKKEVQEVLVTFSVDPEVSGAMQPSQGYEGDVGYDLHTPEAFTIPPNSSKTVDTGIRIVVPELPEFMRDHFRLAALLWSKSGLSTKANIETGAGLIDPGYRGNICVHLHNHGNRAVSFKAGDKVTQLFFVPVLKVKGYTLGEVQENTDRGSKGFGSQG